MLAAGNTTILLPSPYRAARWHSQRSGVYLHPTLTRARLAQLCCRRTTRVHHIPGLTCVFLNGNVRDLRLGGVFRLDIVLEPLGRYPRHRPYPCQRDPFQQQLIDERFGFRQNRLPYGIFHELSPRVFTREFGLSRVNMTVLDYMPRSASWTDWHPLFLTSRLPAILPHYPLRTTRDYAL